jgi:hypothetical protein
MPYDPNLVPHEVIESVDYWAGETYRWPRWQRTVAREQMVCDDDPAFVVEAMRQRYQNLLDGYKTERLPEGEELKYVIAKDAILRVVQDHRIQTDEQRQEKFDRTAVEKESDRRALADQRQGFDHRAWSIEDELLDSGWRFATHADDFGFTYEREVDFMGLRLPGGYLLGVESHNVDEPSQWTRDGIRVLPPLVVGRIYRRPEARKSIPRLTKIVSAHILSPR